MIASLPPRWFRRIVVSSVSLVQIAVAGRLQPAHGQAAAQVRLSGYVRSEASGEVIRYAQVSADGQAVRVESNQDGFFVLALPRGEHVIRIRAVGYTPSVTTLMVEQSLTRDFSLKPMPFELEEISVAGDRDSSDADPGSIEMSTTRLDLKTIKLVPVVMGELDPIRTLTLLPGV
ncbi:MAG: carboxypeptidase regulatory-like domain-containing protein, partial [Gemmatimonadetes bacterium]|nr:carboxypeptidase regulatory-like domain-containing protein [Gemmatimonadota bacterium]